MKPIKITSVTGSTDRFLRPLLLVVALFVLAGCATDAMHRSGMSLIIDGRYEEGLSQLEQAAQADPKNTELRSTWLRQREQAVNRVLNAAGSELASERYDAADALYRRALGIEPGNQAARNGLNDVATERRHAKWIADAQAMFKKGDAAGAKATVALILVERPGHVKANQLRYQLEEARLKENIGGPRLNIKGRRPVTLQFRDANLKMVLEAISRTTGVNILVDKDVRNDVKVTIFVKDTGVEETLDLILLQNQLEKRVLGENSVLVYPHTPAKSKDYQELKVRRFALVNADPKQAQSMIKTILKTRDVYVDERSNAVVIRDTPEAIRLAERLVAAMDQPEPEVMLEVELLDVDRQRALDLGIDWPTSLTASLPGRSLTALRNSRSADINVSALSLTIQAKGRDSDTRTLATPRIRVRNKEKAKVLIGDRTPVISSAAVPGSGVTGTAAVFNTSIQYLETGIKLEVEPTIYLDGNVAIKVNLEVSKLGSPDRNSLTGTVAYPTTTTNASTVIRLKDGESQVMGGLIQSLDSHGQSNKIPGLGDVPFFGRLFGVGNDQWNNRELVLVITPHIIRNNQVSEADLLELWSGTESNINYLAPDLKVAPSSGVVSQSSPAAAATAPRLPPPPPGARAPAPQTIVVAPAIPATVLPLAAPPLAAQPTSLAVQLNGPAQARVGDRISVAVNAQGGAVSSLSFTMSYDADVLKAVAVTEGDMMRRTGVKSTFDSDIDDNGKVVASLSAEAGSASGNGSIASVQFEVVSAQRPALLSIATISASSDGSTNVPVATPQALSIAIQP